MKVKDIVKLATNTTTKVEVKISICVSVFNGTFDFLADEEELLKKTVNSFRIEENRMILFVK